MCASQLVPVANTSLGILDKKIMENLEFPTKNQTKKLFNGGFVS